MDEVRNTLRDLPDNSPKDINKRLERREKALCDAYGRALDKMFCVDNGYFRDSYNSTNLLWALQLNWWGWFGDYLDGKGYLHPQHTRIILNKIESIPVTEARLKHYLKDRNIELGKNGRSGDEEFKEWLDFFIEKRERFIRFLKIAIEVDSPIMCSI